jgi:hypothetical protein
MKESLCSLSWTVRILPTKRSHMAQFSPTRALLKETFNGVVLSTWATVAFFFLTIVGEFRKTRHPRNVKFDKVLETCFSGAGNSRFSEAWNLWSLEFANVWSSGTLIRWRNGVTNMRKPGTSSWRWRELRRTADSGIYRGPRTEVTCEDLHEPMKKRKPIREFIKDPVRESRVKTVTNLRRSKVKVVVPKSPGLECELVADL